MLELITDLNNWLIDRKYMKWNEIYSICIILGSWSLQFAHIDIGN